MLEKVTKINIEGKCKVNDKDVKGFRAVVDLDSPDKKLSFHHWDIDKEAIKEHRKTVRNDQAEFEDYAYDLQEKVIADK